MNQQTFYNIFSLRPDKNEARLAWIDYAKGIAIILVVYRHIAYGLLARGISLPHEVIATNDMLYSFRMPLFFLLSGVFFSRSIGKRGAGNFAVTKVNTLLYPYLLWAVIQISLQIIFSQYTNSARSAKDFLSIFLQPRSLDQLWYLFALFNVTMLYLVISFVVKDRKIWQLVAGLVLLGISHYVESISTFYDIALHYIFFAIGDFASAYFFRERTQRGFANPVNLLALTPVFCLLQWYYLFHQDMNQYLFLIIALNGCLFIMLLASWLAKARKLGFLSVLGHYSLYIYLLHVTIFAVLRAILIRLGLDNGVALLLILIPSSIFLSIIIYRILTLAGLKILFTGKFGENRTSKKNSTAQLI